MEQTFAATALCLPAYLLDRKLAVFCRFPPSLLLSFPPRSSTIKPIDRDGPSINNARQRVGRSDSQINRDLSLRGRTSRGRWGKTWPRLTVVVLEQRKLKRGARRDEGERINLIMTAWRLARRDSAKEVWSFCQ